MQRMALPPEARLLGSLRELVVESEVASPRRSRGQ
jgi:hypothetical protein